MIVKLLVDRLASWVQSIDERRDDAVLLDVRRSIQLDGFSCGLHAAVIVLRYHGRGYSLHATQRVLGTDEDGTSTSSLLKLFRQRGLKPVIKAHATLRDLERGIDEGAPSILSMDGGRHWAVAYGYSSQRTFIADSSFSKILRVGLSRDRFRRRWDRWAMLVKAR